MLVAGGLAYERGREQAYAEEAAAAPPPPAYQEVPPAPPKPAPSAAPSDVDELERLGQLHSSGVLTDEEFAAAKQRILGA
jgi:hypothetical protein